jgi:hypothetical protein
MNSNIDEKLAGLADDKYKVIWNLWRWNEAHGS